MHGIWWKIIHLKGWKHRGLVQRLVHPQSQHNQLQQNMHFFQIPYTNHHCTSSTKAATSSPSDCAKCTPKPNRSNNKKSNRHIRQWHKFLYPNGKLLSNHYSLTVDHLFTHLCTSLYLVHSVSFELNRLRPCSTSKSVILLWHQRLILDEARCCLPWLNWSGRPMHHMERCVLQKMMQKYHWRRFNEYYASGKARVALTMKDGNEQTEQKMEQHQSAGIKKYSSCRLKIEW